jgi:ribonuclease HI
MASDVDAVIAALRSLLQEAETRTSESWWHATDFNRWIDQLPGAWRGRWRRLRLLGQSVKRKNLITHVRATLAYLEINRETIAAERRSWWSSRKAKRVAPKELASTAVKPETAEQVETSARPKWLN